MVLCGIWIMGFKPRTSIGLTHLLLSDTIHAASDTIVSTFAGLGMPSVTSLRNMGKLL